MSWTVWWNTAAERNTSTGNCMRARNQPQGGAMQLKMEDGELTSDVSRTSFNFPAKGQSTAGLQLCHDKWLNSQWMANRYVRISSQQLRSPRPPPQHTEVFYAYNIRPSQDARNIAGSFIRRADTATVWTIELTNNDSGQTDNSWRLLPTYPEGKWACRWYGIHEAVGDEAVMTAATTVDLQLQERSQVKK